jgi:GxxExxY protein
MELTENQIAKLVVDAAFCVHKHFGSGLHESVYEITLAHDLRKRGCEVERQVDVPVKYESITFEKAFRLDVIINDKVIVEVKAVEDTHPVHKQQLLTYLRLTNRRLGLLINFNETLIKDGITRVVNGLPDDQ